MFTSGKLITVQRAKIGKDILDLVILGLPLTGVCRQQRIVREQGISAQFGKSCRGFRRRPFLLRQLYCLWQDLHHRLVILVEQLVAGLARAGLIQPQVDCINLHLPQLLDRSQRHRADGNRRPEPFGHQLVGGSRVSRHPDLGHDRSGRHPERRESFIEHNGQLIAQLREQW